MFNAIRYTAYVLVLIGALNWGLVGLFDFNLVSFFFSDFSIATRTIYIIIGISALIELIMGIISYRQDN